MYGDRAVAVYIDNASFHKANSVKEYARDHDIELIFSPVYSPQFQPCELLIGYLKQYVKSERLKGLLNDKE